MKKPSFAPRIPDRMTAIANRARDGRGGERQRERYKHRPRDDVRQRRTPYFRHAIQRSAPVARQRDIDQHRIVVR